MKSSDFQKKIDASWWFLKNKIKIARTISNGASLRVNSQFNKVALDPASSYREIYLEAVSISYYNIILNDYSIFQYSRNSSQSCRLAYLPNPWISGVDTAQDLIEEWEALESLGWIGQEEVSGLISELPYHSSIPSIRFEYAVDQYRERNCSRGWPSA